jgi:phage shock protein PspC (stress-responsive transcriptional regulator)
VVGDVGEGVCQTIGRVWGLPPPLVRLLLLLQNGKKLVFPVVVLSYAQERN